MNVMPLVNLLEATGAGQKGSTLFADVMPPEVTQGILVRGPLLGTPIDYELPGYYKTKFTAIVRAPVADQDAATALMGKVTDTLTIVGTQVESQFFNFCRPRTQPVTFGLAGGGLLEISVEFSANFLEL